MDYRNISNHFAPCGLNRSRCYALSEGEMKLLNTRLEHWMGNFDRQAERFSRFTPVFANKSFFKALLSYLAHGDSLGYRRGPLEILIEGLFVSIKQKSGFLFSKQRVFS